MRLFGKKKPIHVEQAKGLIFTPDQWKKSEESNTTLSYKDANLPGTIRDFTEFIREVLMEDGNITADDVIVCPIDDEYEEWKKENGSDEDEEDLQSAYIQDMSVEKATELMKKNHMDVQYTLACLPVTLTHETRAFDERMTNHVLTKECRSSLLEYLGSIFGHDAVYVPGYMCSCKGILDFKDDLIGLAKNHFEDKVSVKLGKLEDQDWSYMIGDLDKETLSYLNFRRLYIPVVIKAIATSAVFPAEPDERKMDIRMYPDYVPLLSDKLKETFGISASDIDKTRFAELLPDVFGKECRIKIDSKLCYWHRIVFAEEEYVNQFAKELRERIKKEAKA